MRINIIYIAIIYISLLYKYLLTLKIIMKYFIFFLFSITSCKTSNATAMVVHDKNPQMNLKSTFKKMVNANNTYNLFYKVESNMNNPVKIFTYYITDYQTNKMVKTSTQVAAEKIYWKNDTTLAIIPYVEVMKKNDVVEDIEKTNEILIKIK